MASSTCELLVACAALLCAAAPARADGPTGEDDRHRAARAKLVDGVDQLKRGDYAAALATFQAAYALVPSPKIKYDIGLAYLGLRRDTDALRAFDEFLAEAADAPPDKRARAEQYRAELRLRTGAASALAPPPSPPPAAAERPPPPATAPSSSEPLVRPPPSAPHDEAPPRLSRWALSSAVVGALLLAGGLTFGLLAKNEGDNLHQDSEAGGRTFDPSKETNGLRYQTLEEILLVAGGAAVAGGVVLFVLDRRRHAAVVSPTIAGARLSVSF